MLHTHPTHPPSHTTSNPHTTSSGVPGDLIRNLALACVESPDFVERVASDVGAHLLSSSLRTALAGGLAAMLSTRMAQAGTAAEVLGRVDAELGQDWRISAGGEMGAPTPTRDLATIHSAMSAELDKATDTVLRASKLAIDERRGQTGEAAGDAPLDRYRGTRDDVPLADALGPGERSIMLALMERLAGRVRAQGTIIDASAQDTPSSS